MKKFKKYSFWIALSGAVILLVDSLGSAFGFSVDSGIIENIIMSICGILVVLGIVVKDEKKENDASQQGNNSIELKEDEIKEGGIQENNSSEIIIDVATNKDDEK